MTAMDRSPFLSIKFLMQDAPRRPGLRCGSPSSTDSWNFCWLQTRSNKIFLLESVSEPMVFLSSTSIQRISKYNHREEGTRGSAAALWHKTQPFPSKPEHCICPHKLNQSAGQTKPKFYQKYPKLKPNKYLKRSTWRLN